MFKMLSAFFYEQLDRIYVKTVKVIAKIIEDNSGVFTEVPILISENNEVIQPLLEYTLRLKREGKSQSTINRYISASRLLLEYMAANENYFNAPYSLFEVFSSRLYTGTIGKDGLDPSGLYWMPCSNQVARIHIHTLTKLTDWLAEKNAAIAMNPLVKADSFNQRLNYAAWYRRNQHNFLGHIKDKYINSTIHQARNVLGKRDLSQSGEKAIEFPENFYLKGLGGSDDQRVVIRDQLILLLMHGGGLRVSEVFHLWIEDVCIDVFDSNNVKVRIYHPENGKAPSNWRGKSGSTRAAYLKEKFVLTPRNELSGKKCVGWKSRYTDSKEQYLEVHWFPTIFGKFFSKLWHDYIRILSGIERNHPYAFVSFHYKYIGQPYTLNAFHYNYSKGLKRIGLKSSKSAGLSPHAHRHSYAQRLRRAGLQEIIIQKCLHHVSIGSQVVYTTPNLKEITTSLNLATEQLYRSDNSNPEINTIPSWEVLTQNGFNDIDPNHLFSGKFPKFGENNEN